MKLKLLSVLCLLASTLFVTAQTTTLQVNIKPAKNDSLNNCTLQLYRLADSTLLHSVIVTRYTTTFTIKKFSKYVLNISAVGIEPVQKIINVAADAVTINIQLKTRSTALQGVVVTAKKPLIKQDDDKTVVDAEVLANSSTNAYEVLEKTPGAVVDQDGNVYLSSNTPATIQINGREVNLSTADLASLLKSLPAGSVSKIEILRNPSAKYDAASTGGIVNIVLKKGVKLGTNGSVNVGYFQGIYGTETAGFNINKTNDKISAFFSYQFTNRNNYEALNSTRLAAPDTTISQNAYTTYPAVNNYIGGGVDITLNKKWSVGYDASLTFDNNHSKALNESVLTANSTQNVAGSNQSDIASHNNSLYLDNEVSAKYKIDTIGSEWSTRFEHVYYQNNSTQDYTNTYFIPANPALFENGKSNTTKNVFVLQSDLTLKLKNKLTIEAGGKYSNRNSKNAADYFYESGNSGPQIDAYQTNTFKYKETITSLYTQVSKTFYGFTLKPGLRMETTDISGRQLIPKDSSFSIKRTDLFPYVFLKHNLFKMFGNYLVGTLIFRRSITRPYYGILNPYPRYVDQYLFDIGNPKLKPQFTTNYEFNVTYDEFPVFTVGTNNTTDIFSNVTYQDPATKIAYRTYDNLGKSKEVYFRVVGGIPPGGKFFFYAGMQYNHTEYDGLYQGLPLEYKRGTFTFFTYQQFKATPTLIFSINGFMRTKGIQNFYELKNFGALTFSINKTVLKKKASIILSGNDIFGTNKIYFNLNQGGILASGSRINDTRKIGLTLRYNFGIKPKEEKKPVFEQPVESKDN